MHIEQPSLLAALPGFIEATEQQGQNALQDAGELPANMGKDRDLLVSWGVVIHGEAPGDPLFVRATLPEGWTLKPTSHAMLSNLIDDRCRVRACVFYKAAFYDRRANMKASSRYQVKTQPPWTTGEVQDADGTVLYTSPKVAENNVSYDATLDHCKQWLDTHYPLWMEASAYWDD